LGLFPEKDALEPYYFLVPSNLGRGFYHQ